MKKIILLLTCFLSTTVLAHEGPPFPIVVDHIFGELKVSVWADPDTENGTFTFYPEGPNLKKDDLYFEIKANPKDQTGPILKSTALQAIEDKGRYSYTATLPFPTNGVWDVIIVVKNKQNGSVLTSTSVPVEVTPPGPNKSEFVLYMLPFLVVAAIWVRIVLYKRRKKKAQKA